MIALTRKVVILHERLGAAVIPHAFGGALALAYCTAEPRATVDIDLNVFVSPSNGEAVFAALPDGVPTTDGDVATVRERGQVRLRWEDAPIDLFFAYHPFHEAAGARSRLVPFAQTHIPVLDCADLIVFKAIFGRPRDWVDIEAAVDAGVGTAEALEYLRAIVGADSAAYRRLSAVGAADADGSDAYRRAFGSPTEDR